MKNICVLSQKGGTGKTTMADQMAFSLEATDTPYNFYELDSQGGSIHETSEMDNAVVSVIDTPGYLTDNTAAMIQDADVIILPTRASPLEIPALERGRDMIRLYAPDTPTIIVLNAWNRYSNNKAFSDYLLSSERDAETLITIPQSEVVPQAAVAGKSVTEFAPRSKAAEQFRQLTNTVRKFVELAAEPVPVKKKKGSEVHAD